MIRFKQFLKENLDSPSYKWRGEKYKLTSDLMRGVEKTYPKHHVSLLNKKMMVAPPKGPSLQFDLKKKKNHIKISRKPS